MTSHVASSERRGNEDDSPNFRTMAEDKGFYEELFAFRLEVDVFHRLAEKLHPEFLIGVGQQKPADAASHAVANNNHRFVKGKLLLDRVEFAPQDHR